MNQLSGSKELRVRAQPTATYYSNVVCDNLKLAIFPVAQFRPPGGTLFHGLYSGPTSVFGRLRSSE